MEKKRNEKLTRKKHAKTFGAIKARRKSRAAPKALRINGRLPFRIPSEMQNEKRTRQVFRLTTAVFVPHPFPYAAEQRSAMHTVVSGAAETAAGAAGQLAQTSLLNAPILSGRACMRHSVLEYFIFLQRICQAITR